jgi:hypothetical protein
MQALARTRQVMFHENLSRTAVSIIASATRARILHSIGHAVLTANELRPDSLAAGQDFVACGAH